MGVMGVEARLEAPGQEAGQRKDRGIGCVAEGGSEREEFWTGGSTWLLLNINS